MKIAIDIDDVIAETTLSMALWHNEAYGTSLRKEDFDTQMYGDVIKQPPEETSRRLREWRQSRYFDEIQPIEGAPEALRKIAQQHDLILVTARFPDIEEKTRMWVQEYFPGIFDEIHFSKNHHVENSRQKTKWQICEAENADLCIDDVLEYIQGCLAHCDGILFEQPWNRGIKLPDGVSRARSWCEIQELLERPQ